MESGKSLNFRLRLFWLAVAALLLGARGDAAALPISHTFDSDAQGWTAIGATLSHVGSGGNPGGYLKFSDTQSGYMYAALSVSDLSSFIGGSLAFDARLVQNNAGAGLPLFGEVTIDAGATGSATLDLAPQFLTTNWTTYSALLDAASWGLSDGQFQNVLANATQIRIKVDGRNGIGDVTGFDNFSISGGQVQGETGPAVPEPTSLALFALGCAVVALRPRRRSL